MAACIEVHVVPQKQSIGVQNAYRLLLLAILLLNLLYKFC